MNSSLFADELGMPNANHSDLVVQILALSKGGSWLDSQNALCWHQNLSQMIISVMQSRAWEARHRPKNSFLNDSLKWVFSPMTSEFTIAPKEGHEQGLPRFKEEDEPEAYLSVNSSFSPCSSTGDVELKDMGRCRMLVNGLKQCQGWPFGLMCQKPVVLPPLPSTPSESWVWRRVNSKLAHKKY